MASASAALPEVRERLQALTWTSPGFEKSVLLQQPATCLDPAGNGSKVSYGRALFNAPQLLGGQAARAGISCASCHANGRRSAAFFLDGVSDAPGTADVSASFFSIVRANRRFDPKPIPDLAAPGKVARDPDAKALEHFTRGLIVEEFAGREPSADELAAVAAYVRALRPCAEERDRRRTLATDLDLLRETIQSAAERAQRVDADGAELLVSAARFRLGLIAERFAGRGLAAERRRLLAASRELQPLGEARARDAHELRSWLEHFEQQTVPRLVRRERLSLYDARQVDRWVRRD